MPGWGIGYFYAKKSPEQKIIGITTDLRRAGESEGAVVNPMIEGACERIVQSREELMEMISQFRNTLKSHWDLGNAMLSKNRNTADTIL